MSSESHSSENVLIGISYIICGSEVWLYHAYNRYLFGRHNFYSQIPAYIQTISQWTYIQYLDSAFSTNHLTDIDKTALSILRIRIVGGQAGWKP